MEKVRWGVIGAAKIAYDIVIPAMQQSKYCDVAAIASRNINKAKEYAGKLGIKKAYGSYEELLNDREIDAVYIPLPNHLHVEWTIKSLQAGKHVLCEKPIGLNAGEAEYLLNEVKKYPNLKVMEAFMYRFHPQWHKVKQLVQEGKIGKLRTIQSFFCYNNPNPNDIRNKAEIGGGGLLDIGCYCISFARYIFNEEPNRVFGEMEYDKIFGTDILSSGMLNFTGGTSTFTCSTQIIPYQRINIFGTEGRIEIEIPVHSGSNNPRRIWFQHDDQIEEIYFDVCNQYTIQGEQFSLAVINNSKVPTPLEDALGNMKVIDGIVQSSKAGSWIEIK